MTSYEQAVDTYGEDVLYTKPGHQFTSTSGSEMILGVGQAYDTDSYKGGAYASSNPDYPIYSKDNPPSYWADSPERAELQGQVAGGDGSSTVGLTLAGLPQMAAGGLLQIPVSKEFVKKHNLVPRVTGFKGMNKYTNWERVFYLRSGGSAGSLSKFWGKNLISAGKTVSGVGFGLDATTMLLDFNSYQNSSSYKGLGSAGQFNYQNVGPSWLGGKVANWWNN